MSKLPKPKVLFIDDSQSEIEFLKLLFEIEEIPLDPKFMNNAKDALKYLGTLDRADFPKVVVVDINMPFMNGFEFAQAYTDTFYKQQKNTLLFIYSSSINSADIKKAEAIVGVKSFIPKPFSADIYKEKIAPLIPTQVST